MFIDLPAKGIGGSLQNSIRIITNIVNHQSNPSQSIKQHIEKLTGVLDYLELIKQEFQIICQGNKSRTKKFKQGEFREMFLFYQQSFERINKYYDKFANQYVRSTVKGGRIQFWEKLKVVIKCCTVKSDNLQVLMKVQNSNDRIIEEYRQLQAQVSYLKQKNEIQMNILSKLKNCLIFGQISEFQNIFCVDLNDASEKKRLNDLEQFIFEMGENYKKFSNFEKQIVHTLSSNFTQWKQKQQTVPLSERCLHYVNDIAKLCNQTKSKLNTFGELQITALIAAQRIILKGNWEQQFQRYTQRYNVNKLMIERIFFPLLDNCKKLKQLHSKLNFKAMKYHVDQNSTIIDQCLDLEKQQFNKNQVKRKQQKNSFIQSCVHIQNNNKLSYQMLCSIIHEIKKINEMTWEEFFELFKERKNRQQKNQKLIYEKSISEATNQIVITVLQEIFIEYCSLPNYIGLIKYCKFYKHKNQLIDYIHEYCVNHQQLDRNMKKTKVINRNNDQLLNIQSGLNNPFPTVMVEEINSSDSIINFPKQQQQHFSFKKNIFKKVNEVIRQLNYPIMEQMNEEQIKNENILQYMQKIKKLIAIKKIGIEKDPEMFQSIEDQQFVMRKLNEYIINEEIVGYNLLCSSKNDGNISTITSNHSNTLLLILTKNDSTIALYSTMPSKQAKGILICVSSKKTYPLSMANNLTINKKDRVFLERKEIRISQNVSNEVDSSIVMNSTFQIGLLKYYDEIGLEKTKSITIKGFKIYQVQFKVKQIQKKEQITTNLIKNGNDFLLEKEINELREKMQRYRKIIYQLNEQNTKLKSDQQNYEKKCENQKLRYEYQINKQKSQIDLQKNQCLEHTKLLEVQQQRVKQLEIKEYKLMEQKQLLEKKYKQLKSKLEKDAQKNKTEIHGKTESRVRMLENDSETGKLRKVEQRKVPTNELSKKKYNKTKHQENV